MIGQGLFVTDWIKPWGTIFIKLLKLIAVPLVFISLIKGVTGMKDIKKLSQIGFKTLGIYLLTTFIAVAFGLGMVSLIKPGNFFPREKAEEYKEQFFDKDLSTCFFRISQEALTNITKHANATKIIFIVNNDKEVGVVKSFLFYPFPGFSNTVFFT